MRFVIRRNRAGQYWWRAVGDNNEIMAASELMQAKASCLSAIQTVKREASSAEVHDMTHEIKERGQV
jgi:uncharacterized protein YegP (UPF0339 family)